MTDLALPSPEGGQLPTKLVPLPSSLLAEKCASLVNRTIPTASPEKRKRATEELLALVLGWLRQDPRSRAGYTRRAVNSALSRLGLPNYFSVRLEAPSKYSVQQFEKGVQDYFKATRRDLLRRSRSSTQMELNFVVVDIKQGERKLIASTVVTMRSARAQALKGSLSRARDRAHFHFSQMRFGDDS